MTVGGRYAPQLMAVHTHPGRNPAGGGCLGTA